MPEGTQVLRQEHEAILKMIGAAEEVARRLERNEAVRQEMLANILEFFRVFADQCHHFKEEELLFPLLESKGLPREGGPTGVMLAEHEQGRQLIREMSAAVEAYSTNVSEAGLRWAQAAKGYAALLGGHIFKENNVLFRIAEQMLTPAEQATLAEGFEKLEVEKMGAGTHERLHTKMHTLLAELAV
jgi:hemerythrin-like domain-containing protein